MLNTHVNVKCFNKINIRLFLKIHDSLGALELAYHLLMYKFVILN